MSEGTWLKARWLKDSRWSFKLHLLIEACVAPDERAPSYPSSNRFDGPKTRSVNVLVSISKPKDKFCYVGKYMSKVINEVAIPRDYVTTNSLGNSSEV